VRVGIADHFGWAVAVTASAEPRVIDRRRLELIEPGLPAAPIHYEGKHLDPTAASALVAKVRASVVRATTVALGDLAHSLPGPIVSISLRSWPSDFPGDIAVQLRPPYEARVDAIMYRQVLAEVSQERGWAICRYDAKTVLRAAIDLLGDRAAEVLPRPPGVLGSPWTQDHRVALAATIVAAAAAPH
jgi:hypothetical protein